MAFGCATRRELYSRLSAVDLAEWEAFYRIEPWGPERGDMQAGIVASAVAAYSLRPPRRLYRPDEYIMEFGKREEDVEAIRRANRAALDRAISGKWGKRG